MGKKNKTGTYDEIPVNDTFVYIPKHQNSLLIQLFYDDLETAGPLGSKRDVHKVAALYFVLKSATKNYLCLGDSFIWLRCFTLKI